jgi:Protein of unknown function (DUF2934)
MATRSRASTNRPKKSPSPPIFSGEAIEEAGTRNEPPVLTDEVGRDASGSEESRDDEQTGYEREPIADITESALEQREIPSFSLSREARIAEAAYWRAERRGFTPGRELEDWLAAERQIDEDEGREVPKTG